MRANRAKFSWHSWAVVAREELPGDCIQLQELPECWWPSSKGHHQKGSDWRSIREQYAGVREDRREDGGPIPSNDLQVMNIPAFWVMKAFSNLLNLLFPNNFWWFGCGGVPAHLYSLHLIYILRCYGLRLRVGDEGRCWEDARHLMDGKGHQLPGGIG